MTRILLRSVAVLLAIALLPPAEGFSQSKSSGKKLLWSGVALVGGGVSATIYGAHARNEFVPQYVSKSSCSPTGALTTVASASGVFFGQSATSCVLTPTPTASGAVTVTPGGSTVSGSSGNEASSPTSTTSLSGYKQVVSARWSIVGPAVGSAIGGTVIALLGVTHRKIAQRDGGWRVAANGKSARLLYSW